MTSDIAPSPGSTHAARPESRPGATWERRAILAAAGLAFLLSVAGVDWGLPSRFHPDEKADVAAAMLREGRWFPDSYINPSLPLQLTLPLVAVQQRVASGLGEPWSDPLLAARVLSALVTALGAWAVGRAGATLAPGGGALAALLLALAPGIVNLGHFATPEPFLVAATAVVLLAAVAHAEGRTSAAVLGIALGLACSTKYTAAALVVPALAALWFRRRRPCASGDRWSWLAAGLLFGATGLVLAGPPGAALAARLHLPDLRLLHPESARSFVASLARVAAGAGAALIAGSGLAFWARTRDWASAFVRREVMIAGACAFAAFIVGTPGAVVEPRSFLSDLAFNAQTRHEYKGLVGEGTSFLPYLGLAADALTLPVLAAALAGLLITATRAGRSNRGVLVLALAAVAPYLLVASSGHQAMRFLVAALPAAVCLASLALTRIREARARRLLAAAVAARSALAAILVVRLFFVDSRLLAEKWMATHLPPGSIVDVITNHEGYAPRVPPGRSARVQRALSREMAPAERFEEAAAAYPGQAAPWLVMTGAFYERFLDHPDQKPERTRFFRDLLEGRAGFEVAARFHQEGWLRPPAEFLDPQIVILRKTAE